MAEPAVLVALVFDFQAIVLEQENSSFQHPLPPEAEKAEEKVRPGEAKGPRFPVPVFGGRESRIAARTPTNLYTSGKGGIMELTASNMNSIQDKNAGAMSINDGLPSAKMANVMCPAKETESTVA